MTDHGILNSERVAKKPGLKPRVGKNPASRQRLRRTVSKARRRFDRMITERESAWAEMG